MTKKSLPESQPELRVAPTSDRRLSGDRRELAIAAMETLLIFMVFATFCSSVPPDINESHYLTKAKHFWNQDWCPGDIFLASSFSHWLFYSSCGWVTKFVTLSTFAWIGRTITWLAMAWAWRRLSWRLIPTPFVATFSAIVFLLLNERFHLAGEWVVGGFEAKGIAYVFVLLAMGDAVANHWKSVWPWLGTAAAFHVLVGGWATIAMGLAWLLQSGVDSDVLSTDKTRNETQAPATNLLAWFHNKARPQIPTMLLGLLLLAIGALPPLIADRNVSPEDAAAASLIYVNQRIAHHLSFSAFPTAHVARFVFLIIIFLGIFRLVRRERSERVEESSANGVSSAGQLSVLFNFAIGSLLISLAGLFLSGLADSSEAARIFSARWLRFYWFRLSDFAVPATTSLSIGWFVGHWFVEKSWQRKICAGVVVSAIFAAAILNVREKHSDSRPNADRRTLISYPDDAKRTQRTFENWRKVCNWISNQTPTDAVFITPSDQQTFKWYAGRAEVVNWKDIPQDAEEIIEWDQRVRELLIPQKQYPIGLMSYSDDQLRNMANKYGAHYLVLPQEHVDLSPEATELNQVYPRRGENMDYVVFEFND